MPNINWKRPRREVGLPIAESSQAKTTETAVQKDKKQPPVVEENCKKLQKGHRCLIYIQIYLQGDTDYNDEAEDTEVEPEPEPDSEFSLLKDMLNNHGDDDYYQDFEEELY